MTRIRLFLFIIAISVPSLAAAQQSMKFEEAGSHAGRELRQGHR